MNETIDTNHKLQKKWNGLYCFLFLLFFTNSLISQTSILDKEISFKARSSVFDALKQLEEKTGYYFSYDADLFDAKQQIEIEATDKSLREILNMIFSAIQPEYKVIGNQIVIYKEQSADRLSSGGDTSHTYTTIRIGGQILEKTGKQPVAYASIVLHKKGRGVVSNNDGFFTLAVWPNDMDDTLVFSCLGFKKTYMPVSQFIDSDRIIYLEEDYISIQEVVIRKINPVYLVEQAIKNRPQNYTSFSCNFNAFYRETIQKGKEYIAVTEAVVKGYKSPYLDDFSNDQVKVIKGRKIIDIQNTDTVLVKMQAGLKTILLQDIMKHLPDFLVEGNTSVYLYSLRDIVTMGNEDSYLVGFTPKEYTNKAFYKGKMYIEDKTYAVRSTEFQIHKSSLPLATSSMIVRRPRNFKAKITGARYVVQYEKIGSANMVHYLRNEIDLKIRKKKDVFNSSYLMVNEMVITAIDTVDVQKIPAKETVKYNEVLKEQVVSYDEGFWADYDVISPELSLIEALEKKSKKD